MLINPFKGWDSAGPPINPKVKFVTHFDAKENYDLAILHYDQQCIEPRISKGRILKDILKVLPADLPKVIINHQTPFSDRLASEKVISETHQLIGHIPMITNSKQAADLWGWGHPIIHGLDASEYYDLPKEPRVVTVLTPAGMEAAYKRDFIHDVMELSLERNIPFYWVGVNKPRFSDREKFKDFLGRSLIYFNGTHHSPMPRSRTEAQLSGCAIVTTAYHDATDYITHGKTGYIVDRVPDYRAEDRLKAKDAVDLLEGLINNYKSTLEIGQKGKQVAVEKLNVQSFQNQWEAFLIEYGILK